MPLDFIRKSKSRSRVIACAALVQFIASALVATLWLRSTGVTDRVGIERVKVDTGSHEEIIVNSFDICSDGKLTLSLVRFVPNHDLSPQDSLYDMREAPASWRAIWHLERVDDDSPVRSQSMRSKMLAFAFSRLSGADGYTGMMITCPYWAIIAVLQLPCLYLVAGRYRRALLRRRAIRAKRCIYCGYDLRGCAGRCPECGHPVL